jgi:hypothetical protein
MAPNRKIRREFKLDEFRDQAADALGMIPGIEITLNDDTVIAIPHPMFLSDDTQIAVDLVQNRDDEDRDEHGNPSGKIDGEKAVPFTIRLAKAILGDEAHERFIAAGGSANDVALAWQYMTKEMQQDQGPKLPR